MTHQATLLSIAGSDPSGGAGIQADLKTMTAIGVYGAAAISCLTVQNSQGVQYVVPLEPSFVQAQVQAVLDDHIVSHIKIGMLGTVEIVEAIGELLQHFHGTVIYDPVLAASTGESLLGGRGAELLRRHLLPKISYLTPNISELEFLSNEKTQTAEDGIHNAESLLKLYPHMMGVIVKGGHLAMDSTSVSDFLVLASGKHCESKRRRIDNNNLHGTGCTYSSAFASYLCLGDTPESAFKKTGAFMDRIIRDGTDTQIVNGNNNGPLLHYLQRATSSE